MTRMLCIFAILGLAVAAEPVQSVEEAPKPCCQGHCADPSKAKYYSIAKSMFGKKHCGECCMDPKKYDLFHHFESNLTKADNDSPCKAFGYTAYDSTDTHGFGPISMTLDLYNLPEQTVVEEAPKPCCQGHCADPSKAKYYSIAKSMFGKKHCGECCMDPKKYDLFHHFESNLTKADNDSPCKAFGYTAYDSTDTHGFGPISMTLDLYNLPEQSVVEEAPKPCCQGHCADPSKAKYYSIAKSMFGKKHCGECCMDPKKYDLFHHFESNLTKADNDSPCKAFGYTTYDSTDTHGFGPISMTLDLYNLPEQSVVEEAPKPCCQGHCADPSKAKYYSIAKSMFGKKHCGECCMDPKKYDLFHHFESNLTKADNDSPCKAFGYTTYDSTDTHGFGPISMTLDLYNLPEQSIDQMAIVV